MRNPYNEAPMAATNEASNLSATSKELTMKSVAKAKSDFTIFKFGASEIRVISKAGEPWFVAKDVCDALQLSNSRKALLALDSDEKGVTLSYTLKGNQEVAVVSESGMYTLVLRCRDAVNVGTVPYLFRKWVTAEVLPAIRKNGVYSKTAKTTTDERTPLRDAVNILVSKKSLMYPEAYAMIHQRFNVDSIDELTLEQIPLAVEYAHKMALEGEYLGKQKELASPTTKLTDNELHTLCWLWNYSTYMAGYMIDIEPLLRVAEHRLAPAYHTTPREAIRVMNASRRLLERETMHIRIGGDFEYNDWTQVLSRMRIGDMHS